ncbi:hypothetical protein [Microbacterium sp. GXF7504]
MTEPTHPKRPAVVIAAVVFVAVGAAVSIVGGLLILLSRYQVPADDVLAVSLLGAATVLFGLLNLALAAGIGRGSRLARLLVTVFAVLEIATQVVTVVRTDGWDASALVDLSLNVLVLAALWLPPGARYFRRAVEAAPTTAAA